MLRSWVSTVSLAKMELIGEGRTYKLIFKSDSLNTRDCLNDSTLAVSYMANCADVDRGLP